MCIRDRQYPHIEMRFRLLDNDAVAEGVEQGELDAGLVMDLGCAAPVSYTHLPGSISGAAPAD